jgi:RNA polymerase sigma-70 factor (ECF subfamily)
VIRSRPDRWFDRFRRTGDARLLARVFDAVAPELWRVAAHLCRDRHLAEDAVQATFLSAIEAPHDWDATRPLVPWLLGMLGNRVREQRRRSVRTPDAARLERQGERDPAEVAADREVATTLQQALARLDEPYRSTLEQHLVHGLAAHEIAREQDLPAGTVRMRLHRGLDQLRSKLPPGLVAAGGAALALQTGALAAMRTRVLGEVPGGAAVAAGSGHVGSFVIGVLVMNKMLYGVLGSALAVLLTWWAWPDAATAGATAPLPPATTAVAEPAAATSSSVAAAPAPLPAQRIAARVRPQPRNKACCASSCNVPGTAHPSMAPGSECAAACPVTPARRQSRNRTPVPIYWPELCGRRPRPMGRRCSRCRSASPP